MLIAVGCLFLTHLFFITLRLSRNILIWGLWQGREKLPFNAYFQLSMNQLTVCECLEQEDS